jgi:hypothetical protein
MPTMGRMYIDRSEDQTLSYNLTKLAYSNVVPKLDNIEDKVHIIWLCKNMLV